MSIRKGWLPAARKKKVTVRSPNLTAARTSIIVELIRSGPSGMTWDDVCDLVEQHVGPRYSRQALSNSDDIRLAYKARRSPKSGRGRNLEALADIGESPEKTAKSSHKDEVERLRRKIAELEIRQNHLLETIARLIFHAGQAGLDEASLIGPLPEITRSKNH